MTAPPASKPPRRLSPLTPLVRGGILLVAVVGASWQELLRGDGLGPIGLLLLGLLVAGGLYGLVSWLLTRYWIDDLELRVDTGVLFRQSRRIRIDRLQGIDIVQPIVARLLGLAELRMDVAGGGSREGSLAFLPLAEARALKETLLARRDAARGEVAGPPAADAASAGHPWDPRLAGGPAGPAHGPAAGLGSPTAPIAAGEPPSPTAGAGDGLGARHASSPAPGGERVLLRLDPRLLVASLVVSTEAVWTVLVGALLLLATTFSAGAVGVAGVPALVGVVLVQARRLAAYYRFTVSDTEAGLHVSRGMFSLVSQTIALHRVQGVSVSEPWLWRIMGWARVDVSVAGYGSGGADEGTSSSTVLPVGRRPQAMALASHLLQGLDVDAVPLTAPPSSARWATPVWWRFMRAGCGDVLMVSRAGLFTRRTHAVAHARVQSLRIAQGPWQRALGLADLFVDSPPGPVRVRARQRPADEARVLLDRAVVLGRVARASRVRPRAGSRSEDPAAEAPRTRTSLDRPAASTAPSADLVGPTSGSHQGEGTPTEETTQ